EEDAIAFLHLEGGALAALEELPVAETQDAALLRLLLGAVGQQDAAGRPLLRLDTLDHDLVIQRYDFHPWNSCCRKRESASVGVRSGRRSVGIAKAVVERHEGTQHRVQQSGPAQRLVDEAEALDPAGQCA